jgi:preprotein translocase subunit SecG
METVVIVIHLMVILALIAVVLLQRSEGGALGVGGSNQFMTSRGQGNVLTRATTILGAAFFITSLLMSVLTRLNAPPTSVLETNVPAQTAPVTAPATGTPATSPADTGAGVVDELNRYLSGPPKTGPSTSAPDTSGGANPLVAPTTPAAPAPQGGQAPTSQ